jgi:hypothetical protein
MVLLIGLTLRWSGFLSRDGFARPLARTGIGVGSLAAHRQVFAMTQAPIRSHINVTLDIHRHIAPQITLDFVLLI